MTSEHTDPNKVDRPIPGQTRPPEGALFKPLSRVEENQLTRKEEADKVRGQQTFYSPEIGPAHEKKS